MTKRRRETKLDTLLIVGEGSIDEAFISHMKFLFDSRDNGQKVTIDSGDGGSPHQVIRSTVRKHQHKDFNRMVVLLDSDVPIEEKTFNLANKKGIELIISKPHCLDCMLLEVLGRNAGDNCALCKRELHNLLSGKPTEKESYENLFTAEILEECEIPQIVKLKHLLQNNRG